MRRSLRRSTRTLADSTLVDSTPVSTGESTTVQRIRLRVKPKLKVDYIQQLKTMMTFRMNMDLATVETTADTVVMITAVQTGRLRPKKNLKRRKLLLRSPFPTTRVKRKDSIITRLLQKLSKT